MLLTAAMMLFGSQATAFAYVDQGTEAAQEKSTTETEEPVVEDTHTEENGDPFSVPGNGEVRDDITDDSSKEFLTIKTKNNNTFYIVIDRAATTNNVYMLSQIDENDLKEFLDEDQQQTLETASSVVLECLYRNLLPVHHHPSHHLQLENSAYPKGLNPTCS